MDKWMFCFTKHLRILNMNIPPKLRKYTTMDDDYANSDNDKFKVLIAAEPHDIYTCDCETNNGENIPEDDSWETK